jgi:putative PIN family toxin of toxin-antitoxin system
VIRTVLDTNVLVSIALPRSRLHALLTAWQEGRCRLLVSSEIFEEYLQVLTYPKFRLSSEDIKRILERELRPYAELVKVTTQVEVVRADPSDDKFLACAVDGRADVIVSGDQHLLALRQFQGIPILTAHQLLDRLARR